MSFTLFTCVSVDVSGTTSQLCGEKAPAWNQEHLALPWHLMALSLSARLKELEPGYQARYGPQAQTEEEVFDVNVANPVHQAQKNQKKRPNSADNP